MFSTSKISDNRGPNLKRKERDQMRGNIINLNTGPS